ncbi:MAG: C-GCAxxG-C-C family protein [Eubacteriales bacterium]|nr:C-GCAxxG-C-C family protein [Eubacteriales bacterium]
MESRVEKTIEKHDKGYNCAQAVACTYCDLVGIDEETMFKLTEALGAGMGNMEGTCGAVSGACVLAGMKRSSGNLAAPDSKGKSYKLSKAILNEFKGQNGSVICKELKGVGTGKILRACPDCIRDAARIAEDVLFGEE